jgi:transcriptional regulator with XRE-family HTH domain
VSDNSVPPPPDIFLKVLQARSHNPFGPMRRIMVERARKGWSQQALAYRASCDQGTISAVERGMYSLPVLQRCAKALGYEGSAASLLDFVTVDITVKENVAP